MTWFLFITQNQAALSHWAVASIERGKVCRIKLSRVQYGPTNLNGDSSH